MTGYDLILSVAGACGTLKGIEGIYLHNFAIPDNECLDSAGSRVLTPKSWL